MKILTTAGALLLAVLPCVAQQPAAEKAARSYDFNQVLVGYDDKPIQAVMDDSGKSTTVTLGATAIFALKTPLQRETSHSITDEEKRVDLMHRIYVGMRDKKPVPMQVDEVALIKSRIVEVVTMAEVAVAAARILDPPPTR